MCSLVAGLTALSGIVSYKAQQAQAEQQAQQYRNQAELQRSQAAQYRAQEEAAKRNAEIENRKVEQQVDNTAREQSRMRAQRATEEGKLRASAGASGLGFGGSVGDLLSVSNENYLTDQYNLLTNSRNQTFDTKVVAANYLNQANSYNRAAFDYDRSAASYEQAANDVQSNARWAGLTTLLGTATSIAGNTSWGGGSAKTAASTANPYSGWDKYSKYRLNRG